MLAVVAATALLMVLSPAALSVRRRFARGGRPETYTFTPLLDEAPCSPADLRAGDGPVFEPLSLDTRCSGVTL